MNAFERAAFDGKITRFGGTGCEDDGVKILKQFFRRIIFPDFGVALEHDAFGFELLDAAQDDFFLVQLHVRDAVHEQTTGAIGAFENGYEMAGLVQLRGGAQSGGAGADDGDFLAGAGLGWFRIDPAIFPTVIGDADLDVLDGDRRVVHAEHAGAFARGGADAAGEVREVVRLVETFERFLPETAVNEVVPLGNQVVDGATAGHAADERAGMAEGNAAIHAPGALLFEVGIRHVKVEFLPVVDTLRGRTVFRQFTKKL